MELTWVAEPTPLWNADKRRVVGAWPRSFPSLCQADEGAVLPGRWWRAEREGEQVVGYAWMDVTWGDAEVWMAVDPAVEGEGVGSFLLRHLVEESRRAGLRYLFNAIPKDHPEPARLRAWLEKRGFGLSGDGLLKRAA